MVIFIYEFSFIPVCKIWSFGQFYWCHWISFKWCFSSSMLSTSPILRFSFTGFIFIHVIDFKDIYIFIHIIQLICVLNFIHMLNHVINIHLWTTNCSCMWYMLIVDVNFISSFTKCVKFYSSAIFISSPFPLISFSFLPHSLLLPIFFLSFILHLPQFFPYPSKVGTIFSHTILTNLFF